MKKQVKWGRPQTISPGRTVYASKCGRFVIQRTRFAFELTDTKTGDVDKNPERLADAKLCAQFIVDDEDTSTTSVIATAYDVEGLTYDVAEFMTADHGDEIGPGIADWCAQHPTASRIELQARHASYMVEEITGRIDVAV